MSKDIVKNCTLGCFMSLNTQAQRPVGLIDLILRTGLCCRGVSQHWHNH
ncbi:Uncharacterised protein [Serratia liquefaciens]|nr:Uncharacterised protein [Serratia liquefaciens]